MTLKKMSVAANDIVLNNLVMRRKTFKTIPYQLGSVLLSTQFFFPLCSCPKCLLLFWKTVQGCEMNWSIPRCLCFLSFSFFISFILKTCVGLLLSLSSILFQQLRSNQTDLDPEIVIIMSILIQACKQRHIMKLSFNENVPTVTFS